MDMIKEDIDRIKVSFDIPVCPTRSHIIHIVQPSFMSDGELGTSEGLSKVLDITIGTTISILSLLKQASSLIPVPWVQPLIGTVVIMLQAVSVRA
jgi:hypothetical protein